MRPHLSYLLLSTFAAQLPPSGAHGNGEDAELQKRVNEVGLRDHDQRKLRAGRHRPSNLDSSQNEILTIEDEVQQFAVLDDTLLSDTDVTLHLEETMTLSVAEDKELPSFGPQSSYFREPSEKELGEGGGNVADLTSLRRVIVTYKHDLKLDFKEKLGKFEEEVALTQHEEAGTNVSTEMPSSGLSGGLSGFFSGFKRKHIDRSRVGGSQTASHGFAGGNGNGRKFRRMKVKYDFEDADAVVLTMPDNELDLFKIETSGMIAGIEEDQIRVPLHMTSQISASSPFAKVQTARQLAETMPYGIDMVQAPEVWEAGYKGRGVKVCIIDSGLDANHGDFIGIGKEGGDTFNLPWTEDGCGHGTHVAGTVAAAKDSNGVVGVAPESDLVIVRVFANNCGWTFSSSLIAAAEECRNKGAKVINMSLGGGGSSSFESSRFESLLNDDGVISVAAAGNGGNSAFSYPASYPSVVSVAAVASNKNIASFSQYNSQVDLAAPGVSIQSSRTGASANFPIVYSGTSMASPHVAGVAALLLGAASGSQTQKAKDVRAAMEFTAEDRGSVGKDNNYGYGVVQAKVALNCLLNNEIASKCESGTGGGGGDNPVGDVPGYSGWILISDEDFDDQSWGNWNDGGSDAALSFDDTYFNSFVARLRDNSGSFSSMWHDTFSTIEFKQLRIDFQFAMQAMELGEDLLLEGRRADSSGDWTILSSWAAGVNGISNNQVYSRSVVISLGSSVTTVQLRFRCDASVNNDVVFLDNIKIYGA